MNAPLYTVDILRLAASLPEPAQLDRVDGRAEVRSPACGSIVVAEVSADSGGRIEALSIEVKACAFGQASAALVARESAGRTLDEIVAAKRQVEAWLSGERSDAPDWPGIDTLAPARKRKSRHPAILLPFRALVEAMQSSGR